MPVLDKADKNKCEEYEEFVRNSPFTHAMQAPAWAKVKNNWISEYVYLEEDGKITAAMSVLGIKAVDDKTFLYAPRGPVSDFYDVETTKKLIEEARPLFEKHNAFLLRLDPCVKDDKELVKKYRDAGFTFRNDETEIHSFSNPRYEIMLTLKGKTEEELMAGFNSMTRRHIRASYKNGVTSEWGRSQAEIDRFFEHHKTMAERQGITYRPKEYFERLVEAFPEIRIYTSEYGEDYDPYLDTFSPIYQEMLFPGAIPVISYFMEQSYDENTAHTSTEYASHNGRIYQRSKNIFGELTLIFNVKTNSMEGFFFNRTDR